MVPGRQSGEILLDPHPRCSSVVNLEETIPYSNIKQFIIAQQQTVINSNLLIVEVLKIFL